MVRLHSLIAALVVLLGLSACTTSSKFKMTDTLTPAIPYHIAASSPELLGTLHTVIIFKGPGTWKENALWDEYLVTIQNIGESPSVIYSAELIDVEGTPLVNQNDPWILENISKENWKHYREAGISLAMGSLGTAVMTGGLGALYLSGSAAAGAAIAVVPVVMAADLVLVQVLNNQNKGQINKEFIRRHLGIPLTIAAGESTSGSIFFPQAPGPKTLTLFFNSEANSPELQTLEFKFNNTPIAGLHLK
jgi:hypothetical protein